MCMGVRTCDVHTCVLDGSFGGIWRVSRREYGEKYKDPARESFAKNHFTYRLGGIIKHSWIEGTKNSDWEKG